MRKKILLCCYPADFSGVPLYTKLLTSIFEGYADFTILTSSYGKVFSGLKADIIVRTGLQNSTKLSANIKNAKILSEVIALSNPDVIHINGSMFGMVGRLLSNRMMHRRFLYTHHGLPWGAGRSFFFSMTVLTVEIFCLNFTRAKNIAISKMDLGRLRQLRLFGQRIYYIPNAVDIELRKGSTEFNSGFSCADQIPMILNVARFAPQKNHARLLRAFNLIGTECSLCLVGHGTDSDEIKELARSICSAEKFDLIYFEGESANVGDYLSKATVFCLSSDYEGMPLSAIEALGFGVPVVMPDVGGAAELNESGGAEIYSPNTPERLASHLLDTLENDDKRAEMSARARVGYESTFSAQGFRRRMAALYGITI